MNLQFADFRRRPNAPPKPNLKQNYDYPQYNKNKRHYNGQRRGHLPFRNNYRKKFKVNQPRANVQSMSSNNNAQLLSSNQLKSKQTSQIPPLPGTDEYMQRNIEQTSAYIMKQLNNEQDGLITNPPPNALESKEDAATTKAVSTTNAKQKQKKLSTASSTAVVIDVKEIHQKIVNYISNLSHQKKMDFVNKTYTACDPAIEYIQKQKKLEVSRKLKQMSKETATMADNEAFYSLVPDIDIKIEELPKDVMEELSYILDNDECDNILSENDKLAQLNDDIAPEVDINTNITEGMIKVKEEFEEVSEWDLPKVPTERRKIKLRRDKGTTDNALPSDNPCTNVITTSSKPIADEEIENTSCLTVKTTEENFIDDDNFILPINWSKHKTNDNMSTIKINHFQDVDDVLDYEPADTEFPGITDLNNIQKTSLNETLVVPETSEPAAETFQIACVKHFQETVEIDCSIEDFDDTKPSVESMDQGENLTKESILEEAPPLSIAQTSHVTWCDNEKPIYLRVKSDLLNEDILSGNKKDSSIDNERHQIVSIETSASINKQQVAAEKDTVESLNVIEFYGDSTIVNESILKGADECKTKKRKRKIAETKANNQLNSCETNKKTKATELERKDFVKEAIVDKSSSMKNCIAPEIRPIETSKLTLEPVPQSSSASKQSFIKSNANSKRHKINNMEHVDNLKFTPVNPFITKSPNNPLDIINLIQKIEDDIQALNTFKTSLFNKLSDTLANRKHSTDTLKKKGHQQGRKKNGKDASHQLSCNQSMQNNNQESKVSKKSLGIARKKVPLLKPCKINLTRCDNVTKKS